MQDNGQFEPREPRRRRRAPVGVLAGVLALGLAAIPGDSPLGGRSGPPSGSASGSSGGAGLVLHVRGPQGEPVSGAAVTAHGQAPGSSTRVRTSPQGTARLPLAEGLARLEVRAPGLVREQLELQVGPNATQAQVSLHEGGRVRGRVVRRGGDPVVGAEVKAEVPGRREPWKTTTGDGGRFTLDTLPRGSLSLSASAEGFEGVTRRASAGPDPEPVQLVLERTSSLAGRVHAPDGAGAAGATVTIAGSGVWPPRKLETDEDGRFRTTELPPGIYEVRASRGNQVAEPRQGLMVEPGKRLFAVLRLERGATVAGRIVTAGEGEPLRNTEVTVTEGALGLAPRTVRTDEQGRFRMEGLRRTPHRLSARREGYVHRGLRVKPPSRDLEVRMRQGATIAGVVVDTRDAPVEGARLEVLGQSETGSRVTVRRAEPGLRTAMASGEPVDGSGGGGLGVTAGPVPPIGAASGTAPAPEGPGLDPGTALGSGEYRTDDQGRFRMSGIPPGSLQLVARHPDYAPGTSEPRVVRPGGTLEDVRVVVPDGGTIEGRLVDSRGFPVARVPVELRMEHEPVPRIVVSGEDGTFRFAGTRGPVVLTALPNGRPTTRRRIEVPSGETTELELALEQARSTLEGRTVGPRGFPVSGVQLTVRSLRAETPVRRTVQSTEDGTFELPGLPAPPYRVLAKHPDYATTRLARVEGSDRLRVELQPGASIEGKVLDDWSAAPLTDARIELLDEDGSTRETTRTNSQGQFSFQLVPEGNYKINADHEDFLSASAKAVVKRGARGFQDAEVGRIWLKPAGSMAGRVVDAYGRAVPGAELARGSPPSWEGATRSGPDGRFELHSVPPGTVRLTVRHPTAGRTRRADVRVRPKQRTDGLRIRLPGRYREPEAKPGSGVRTGVALTLAKGPDGGVRIARILSGTSAAEADLRAGDRLLRVDGRRVETVRQARDWLRGPQGVQAVLTVQRGGKPRRIFVVRERYSPEP